jgi:hypothetical protein
MFDQVFYMIHKQKQNFFLQILAHINLLKLRKSR